VTGRLLPLSVAVIAALAAGCQEEDPPPVVGSCMGEPAEVVRALGAAPEAVELSDGATISDCLRTADSAADLQNVGVTLANAAEDLEALALEGDETAALQLGYLVGAARKGGEKTSSISAELVHRLERSAGFDGVPAVDDALVQGLAAGEDHG
jgi:hypothetical protein